MKRGKIVLGGKCGISVKQSNNRANIDILGILLTRFIRLAKIQCIGKDSLDSDTFIRLLGINKNCEDLLRAILMIISIYNQYFSDPKRDQPMTSHLFTMKCNFENKQVR